MNNTTIKVSVDATGAESGIGKLKSAATQANAAMDAMKQRQELVTRAMQEAASNGYPISAREANKLAQQYQKLADTAGKSRLEILNQQAASKGVASVFSEMSKQIDEAGKRQHEFTLGSTAARREMLVLAHEASQGSWKQFGGSLLVLGERTDALSLLLSGAGVSAGAFAAALFAMGKAALDGANEARELNAALTLTSNYAGLTSTSLSDMAARISGASGLGKTSELLRGLAATGQYTSGEMEALGRVILRTAEVSGAALEDVQKEYAKLADDPAKWATEHNRSMHFMDTATYQHIQALQEAGDKHEALKAVISAATAQVETDSTRHLSKAADAWRSLGNEVSTFWAKLKQGLSTGPSIQDKIDTLSSEKSGLSGYSLADGRVKQIDQQIALLQEQQRLEQQQADAQAKSAATQAAGVEAAERIDKMRDQLLSNAQKRQKELAQLAKDRGAIIAGGGTVSDTDYASMQANIADRYKDPRQATGSQNSAINAQLAAMAGQRQLIEAQAKRSEAVLKGQRDAGLIDAETYFQKLHDIQAAALDQEIETAQKRADIAGAKKEKAARETALAEVQKLSEQRKQVDDDLTSSMEKYEKQRADNVARYAKQQNEATQAATSGYQEAYDTRNMLTREKAAYESRLKLQDSYLKAGRALDEEYNSGQTDMVGWLEKRAIAKQGYDDQLSLLVASLEQQKQVRESYREQFAQVFKSYAVQSQTAAELSATAFDASFKDISSALDTFVTTGKLNFSTLTSSILADLAKIALHAAEVQIFQSVGTSMGFFSTGGSVGHYADGGHISGAGTGTSDSIPAMLSNGEYVINAASTKKYRGLLESINDGHMAHFATGGAVGSVPASSAGPAAYPVSLTVENHGGGAGVTQEDLVAIAPLIQNLIDKRMAQKMNGQGGYGYKLKHGQI